MDLSPKKLYKKMIVAYKNPFGTQYDPRYLLKLGSDQIFKYNPKNKLAIDMQNAWNKPFSKKYNHRDLLKLGAEYIKGRIDEKL